jgi:hypothetical protein
MYHKQEVKQESKLGDFVETSDNPHDDKKTEITAVYSRSRGTTAKRLKQKKRKEQLDSIKDDDIKREIKKGGGVTIVDDSTESGIRVFDYTVYDYYY